MTRHCPSGHEYTPENTGIDNRGIRFCRECTRIRARRYKAEHPEVVKAHREKYGPAAREKAKPKERVKSRAKGKTALVHFNEGAEAERAAVVAWLRGNPDPVVRNWISAQIAEKEHLK